jgi:hypothetical protein
LPAELDALGEHLSGCAECRRVEATYRETGEHIRQLPTITPPDSFRAAVFAAIRAEDAKIGRTVEQLASDDTQPNLPALRPVPVRTWSPRGPVVVARAAIAVAAVVLLSIGVARGAPAIAAGAPRLASYLSGALSFGQASGPRIVQYQVATGNGHVTSAMTGGHWLVYVVSGAQGSSTLNARQRGTSRTFALPGGQVHGSLTLRVVTDGWVIWQTGTGTASQPWTLWASPLSPNGSALVLVDSQSAASLAGVWAQGNIVLATYATASDGGELARFDLVPGHAAPTPNVIARAQAPTHLLADPSRADNNYYWSEIWSDASSGVHSDLWRMDGSGAALPITSSGTAFTPRTTDGMLLWVDGSGRQPTTVAASADQALALVSGTLKEQGLSGGSTGQVAANAQAGSLQVAGAFVLWRVGMQAHTYDLSRGAPSQVDGAVQAAGYASANGSSLTWGQSGSSTISIYDGR